MNMFGDLIHRLKGDTENWMKFRDSIVERNIASHQVLLHEGEISGHVYVVKKGCLRQWFNKDGKEITFQFFFEGQPVASIDSFMNSEPSLFSIESIEPTTVITIGKDAFHGLCQTYPEFQNVFQDYMYQRFRNYAQLFLSRIKDTPQERYEDLMKNHPEILQRVPQHYIASYLGITPVSLSRIRNRKPAGS